MNLKVSSRFKQPRDSTALHVACRSGETEVVKLLLRCGCNPNAVSFAKGSQGFRAKVLALHYMTKPSTLDLLLELLRCPTLNFAEQLRVMAAPIPKHVFDGDDADPDTDNDCLVGIKPYPEWSGLEKSPLLTHFVSDCVDIMEAMLCDGVPIPTLWPTKSFLCVRSDAKKLNEEPEVLSLLISAGLNGLNDAHSANGNTLLHIAAREGLPILARALLSSAADPWLKNHKGVSATDVALELQHQVVIDVVADFVIQCYIMRLSVVCLLRAEGTSTFTVANDLLGIIAKYTGLRWPVVSIPQFLLVGEKYPFKGDVLNLAPATDS